AALRQALDLNPNLVEAWLLLGRLHAETGDVDVALRAFDKALTLDADHPLALTFKGCLLAEKGRYAEAVPYLKKALARKKDDALLWYSLARCYHSLHRYEEALYAYNETLRLDPDYDDARVSRWRLLNALRQRDRDDAANR
ncbi:tetratricopeptide repeat protein, partial [Calditerricola satsumensis]